MKWFVLSLIIMIFLMSGADIPPPLRPFAPGFVMDALPLQTWKQRIRWRREFSVRHGLRQRADRHPEPPVPERRRLQPVLPRGEKVKAPPVFPPFAQCSPSFFVSSQTYFRHLLLSSCVQTEQPKRSSAGLWFNSTCVMLRRLLGCSASFCLRFFRFFWFTDDLCVLAFYHLRAERHAEEELDRALREILGQLTARHYLHSLMTVRAG